MGILSALSAASGLKKLLDTYGLASPYNKYSINDILFGKLESWLEPFELDGELFVIPADQISWSGSRRDAVADPPGRDGSVITDLGRPSIPITVSFIRFSTTPSYPFAGDARDWHDDVREFNGKLRLPPGSPGSWAAPVRVASPTFNALQVDWVKVRSLAGVVNPNENPNLVGLTLELLETNLDSLFPSGP
jgi:hypothetical protein